MHKVCFNLMKSVIFSWLVLASTRRCLSLKGRLLFQQNQCFMSSQSAEGGGAQEQPPWKEYLGQNEATELDNALFFEYEYSIDQLMEIAGLCVAQV